MSRAWFALLYSGLVLGYYSLVLIYQPGTWGFLPLLLWSYPTWEPLHASLPTTDACLLSSFTENPDHDSNWGGEAKDPGGTAGKPRCPPGQRWAVPSHSLIHQRTFCQAPALGFQDGLRDSGKGGGKRGGRGGESSEALLNLSLTLLLYEGVFWGKGKWVTFVSVASQETAKMILLNLFLL